MPSGGGISAFKGPCMAIVRMAVTMRREGDIEVLARFLRLLITETLLNNPL